MFQLEVFDSCQCINRSRLVGEGAGRNSVQSVTWHELAEVPPWLEHFRVED